MGLACALASRSERTLEDMVAQWKTVGGLGCKRAYGVVWEAVWIQKALELCSRVDWHAYVVVVVVVVIGLRMLGEGIVLFSLVAPATPLSIGLSEEPPGHHVRPVKQTPHCWPTVLPQLDFLSAGYLHSMIGASRTPKNRDECYHIKSCLWGHEIG